MGYRDANYDLPAGETYLPTPERLDELEAMMLPDPYHPAPAGDDPAWDPIRSSTFADAIHRAAADAMSEDPLPILDNRRFLEAVESGERGEFGEMRFGFLVRLATLPMSACLSREDTYLPQIETDIRIAADLRVWSGPGNGDARRLYETGDVFIDLLTCHMAVNIMNAERLLGSRLSPETRELIGELLKSRIFEPFEKRIKSGKDLFWWIKVTHNWNSVCLASVLACALYAKRDLSERAWYVAVTERLISFSEEGFPESGFYTEGVGYWGYGFGHYIVAAELVRAVTQGAIDWFRKPLVEKMSRFGERMQIRTGVFPTYADCRRNISPPGWLMHWENNRIDDARTDRLTDRRVEPFSGVRFNVLYPLFVGMFRSVDPLNWYAGPSVRGIREWFPDLQYLICRPDDADSGLAATCMGGNGGVNHNHNDLGTFTVYAGNDDLICDPGAEVYTARTFGPHRYRSGLLNSFGHPVPRVAGELQVPDFDRDPDFDGAEAYAEVVETSFSDEEDRMVLDLTKGYRAPTLRRLVREFVYRRGTDRQRVEVTDSVEFTTPSEFETAIITYGEWEPTGSGVRIRSSAGAIRVTVESDSGGLVFGSTRIEESSIPWRLAWRLDKPAETARVTITVVAD